MLIPWRSTLAITACFLSPCSGLAATNVDNHGFQTANPQVKQVAIIGAGAAGASTAYHLQKFAESIGIEVNITVFERSSYVGGRSTTVHAYNDLSNPVELGASIFVEVNRILKISAEEFGLQPKNDSDHSGSQMLGIWNGEKFVFTQKDGGWAWWDTTKILWKYGLAPIRTQRLMKATTGRFLKLYDAPFFPFRSLSDRAEDLDLISVTGVTGEQYLTANKIGAPYTTEIIQASTRVNYGQNLGFIHGLETMVCMAIEGAMQIEGGNWRIFDGMLKASKATLMLNTTVTNISKAKGKYNVSTANALSLSENLQSADETFDTVVLAAPLQFADINLENSLLKRTPDSIPYVTLHVTLFTSSHKLNGSHFRLKPGEPAPDTVLTTLSPDEDPSDRKNVVGKSGFFSISTLRIVTNPQTQQREFLYKIFSPQKVESAFLGSLLGVPLPEDLSTLITSPTPEISWYHPHVWQSYPYEYPRVTFEELELARGFYYTSGIESFISTMETSALMGKNVAQLIVDDFQELLADKDREHFDGLKFQDGREEL